MVEDGVRVALAEGEEDLDGLWKEDGVEVYVD
jgi:hypothetical protein